MLYCAIPAPYTPRSEGSADPRGCLCHSILRACASILPSRAVDRPLRFPGTCCRRMEVGCCVGLVLPRRIIKLCVGVCVWGREGERERESGCAQLTSQRVCSKLWWLVKIRGRTTTTILDGQFQLYKLAVDATTATSFSTLSARVDTYPGGELCAAATASLAVGSADHRLLRFSRIKPYFALSVPFPTLSQRLVAQSWCSLPAWFYLTAFRFVFSFPSSRRQEQRHDEDGSVSHAAVDGARPPDRI